MFDLFLAKQKNQTLQQERYPNHSQIHASQAGFACTLRSLTIFPLMSFIPTELF